MPGESAGDRRAAAGTGCAFSRVPPGAIATGTATGARCGFPDRVGPADSERSTMAISNLKPLPSLPSSRRALTADRLCECGCGVMVARRFKPGHDARLLGFVKRVQAGVMTVDDIREGWGEGPADATAKVLAIETPSEKRARIKAEKAAAKAAAEATKTA